MLSDFISLFFPNQCMACDRSLVKGEELICLSCDYEMPKTNSHQDQRNFIAIKFFGKILLEHAVACYRFSKNGKVQQLLHRLKYANKPELGRLIGRKYGIQLQKHDFHCSYDFIVPVPLHRSKLKRRGYNQSTMFGIGLAEALDLPLKNDLVIRKISTPTQTRKSRIERWRNVDTVFVIKNVDEVKNKSILIVDDVITTGATLESCAQVLINAGCKSVGVAAIAAAR